MMEELLIFSFLYISLLNSFSHCLLQENSNYLNISITSSYPDYKIGKKGALSFSTNFFDENQIFDPLDIEENTKFNTTIFNEINQYNNISCRLWKYKSENLNVFCNLDETIPIGKYKIFFKSTFNYKEYEINFISDHNITFEKLDKYSFELYSNLQNIVVEDSKDSYELKFKINAYSNEQLFLCNFDLIAKIDNCTVERNELKCQILKTEIERVMPDSEEEDFYLKYLSQDYNIFEEVSLVDKIVIKYKDKKKEDIFVGITKLLEGTAEDHTCIAYQTNVTNILNIATSFHGFRLRFFNHSLTCGFRKYENNPLLIVCLAEENVQYLGKIEEEKIIRSNIKYNFKIQPLTNN